MEHQSETQYRVRDFFKPSIFEGLAMAVETPVSLGIFAVSNVIGENNPLLSLAYASIPQALTYVCSRVVEFVGRDKPMGSSLGKTAYVIRNTKVPLLSFDIPQIQRPTLNRR